MQKALIRRIRRIMHLNEVRRQFIRELIRKLVSINMYIASVNRRNTFLIYRGNGTINDVGGPHSVYHNPLRRIKMKPHCLAKKWVTYMSMHRDAWLMQKGSGFHSIFTITPLSRTVMISCPRYQSYSSRRNKCIVSPSYQNRRLNAFVYNNVTFHYDVTRPRHFENSTVLVQRVGRIIMVLFQFIAHVYSVSTCLNLRTRWTPKVDPGVPGQWTRDSSTGHVTQC